MYYLSILTFICVHAIAVSGLSLLTGYTGLFSIGQAGFMATGAYTAVVLYKYVHVPFLIAVIAGGLVSVLFSVVLGYPALRNKLEGDAFGIVMLGFVTVVRVSISNIKPVLGGAIGITGIPRLSSLWLVIFITGLMVFCMRNFIKSDYGKNCMAIQQQEPAAEMVGINPLITKLRALMVSAFYAGVAGGLFVFYSTFVSPMSFAESKSNDLIAAVVLGGMCSLSGPIAAIAILVALPEFLRFLQAWRLVFYGLSFILIMLFRPDGLFGYREISFQWAVRLYQKAKYHIREWRKKRKIRTRNGKEGGET